jgi:hypothetical protein
MSRARSDVPSTNERHHVVEKVVRLPRVDEGEDVRVLQPCGDLDFPQEPFGAEGAAGSV